MGIGYKVVWVRGGMGRGHHADNALFVGVCAVFVGWGGVGMIMHQMLLQQKNICDYIFICTILKCSLPVS